MNMPLSGVRVLDLSIMIAGPISTLILADPQILSRNMVPEVDYGNGKKHKIVGNPIKMSEMEREKFTPAPKLGENTAEILRESLHYSSEGIEKLMGESH